MTKIEILDQMKIIASKIGVAELKRQNGEWVSMREILRLRNEFRILQNIYKRKAKV